MAASRIEALVIRAARWSYRIEPTGDGCDVTEQWDDLRTNGVMKTVSGLATGVKDRAAHCRTAMQTTLERLKASAEAG